MIIKRLIKSSSLAINNYGGNDQTIKIKEVIKVNCIFLHGDQLEEMTLEELQGALIVFENVFVGSHLNFLCLFLSVLRKISLSPHQKIYVGAMAFCLIKTMSICFGSDKHTYIDRVPYFSYQFFFYKKIFSRE